MSISNILFRRWSYLLLAAVAGVAVFAITQICYWHVAENVRANHVPVGLVSLGMDIYSYYSFIWQAASGHWVFTNAMTSEPCDRVFFNLQWLVLGKCMGWFGWSPLTTFTVWRFAGAIAMITGFAVLAAQVLPHRSQRGVALLMCAFGGGFGWFIAGLGRAGLVDISQTSGLLNPAMDLIIAVHPFGQILKNPHYSLPHGTFLLFVAAYIQGERTGNTRWYLMAAALAVFQGLLRPYDVITICALIPAFMAAEAVRSRSLAATIFFKRALPVFACLPLLAYYYYIFSIHPVFKWWAIQGKQPPTPLFWHTFSLGLAGVLFAYRLIQYKKRPLNDPAERLLVTLVVTMLVLYHGNHITAALSFSPQIGIPLLSPLILVGLGVLPLVQERWFKNRPRLWAPALVLFLVVNAIGSPMYFLWSARMGKVTIRNYARQTDMDAINWLKAHANEEDVILSNDLIGGRLAFYVNARVALGHWALTPQLKNLRDRFALFARGDLSKRSADKFIDKINPRYIYISDRSKFEGSPYLRRNPDIRLVFANSDVALYELKRRPTFADLVASSQTGVGTPAGHMSTPQLE